jgi:hypothetical protein
VPTQELVITARADLVAILEELHDVLVRIDDQTVDRRLVGVVIAGPWFLRVAASPARCRRAGRVRR